MSNKVKRKKYVNRIKKKRKLMKRNPIIELGEQLKEVKKFRNKSNKLYNNIKDELVKENKKKFLQNNNKRLLNNNQMKKRIINDYGICIKPNENRKIKNFIVSYGYRHITKDIIFSVLNYKHFVNYCKATEPSYTLLMNQVKKNNIENNVTLKDLYFTHYIYDLIRNIVFDFIFHFEQMLNNLIKEKYHEKYEKSDDKLWMVIERFNNHEHIEYYWDAIPNFMFGALLEFAKHHDLKKEIKLSIGGISWKKIIRIKDLRNKVDHLDIFWIDKEHELIDPIIIYLSMNSKNWVDNRKVSWKFKMDRILNKYEMNNDSYAYKKLKEIPLFSKIFDIIDS